MAGPLIALLVGLLALGMGGCMTVTPGAAPPAASVPAEPVAAPQTPGTIPHAPEASSPAPPLADADPPAVAVPEPGTRDLGSEVAGIALSMLGTPYRRGGSDTKGFDCSGLVHFSYAKLAHTVPRDTRGLMHASVPVDSLRTGDLLFFHLQRRRFSHVGIYIGEGRFVHAPATGGNVRVEQLAHHYWRKHFAGGRRMTP